MRCCVASASLYVCAGKGYKRTRLIGFRGLQPIYIKQDNMQSIIDSKKRLDYRLRVWEAASTGAMVAAAVLAGADAFIVLIHLIHWVCSAMYHIHPTLETLDMDSSTIRLIIIERVNRYNPAAAGMLCAHSLGQLPTATVAANVRWAILYAAFGYAHLMIDRGIQAIPLVVVMSLSLFFWKFSGVMIGMGYDRVGTLLCVLYHALLGLGLYLELILEMPLRETTIILDALRYSMWFVYPFFIARSAGFPPFRLQNVASLVASTVLTPIGWVDTIGLLSDVKSVRRISWSRFDLQHKMGLFYIVFIVADWVLGVAYYPAHFTMLEGCIHHGLTGAVVVEAIMSGRSMNPMMAAMVVETSTIVLSLNRVFPSTRTPFLRGIAFPTLFILTRIVWITILGFLVWREGMYFHAGLSALFGVLNIYWISKFFSKKIR